MRHSYMKSEFIKVSKFFSEDPMKISIDEFFCVFAEFMGDFEVKLPSQESG